MAICRIYQLAGGSVDDYEGVNQQLQAKLGEGYTPEGARVHIAGAEDGVFRVIELWESREDVERFMQDHLGEYLQKADFPNPPEIIEFEVHSVQWAD